MSGRRPDRSGAAPRSVLILTALLVAAVGTLFFVRQNRPTHDFTLGGPLFPVATEDIEGLLLTRQGAQYRLDRTDQTNWSLTGAVADYVDSLAVVKLLDTLTGAYGGPLLAGTETEDRRYEFNGPEAIRLTLFVTGAEPLSLALGTTNPVGGNVYASGVGREACFMVPTILRKALADLPGTLQYRSLLPLRDRDDLERVEISRGGRQTVVEFRDNRWWLLMPPEGPAFLGEKVRVYQAMYDDRRVTDDRGVWVLASSPAVHLLVYTVCRTLVREIKPAAEGAAVAVDWELDPPWAKVVLTGLGINPDPAAGDPDRMAIAFGPALDQNRVPAMRRGHVLLADGEALEVLEKPLGILAHRTALTFLVLQSDVIQLEREGRLLVRGTRTGTAITKEGRNAWLTEIPRTIREGLDDSRRHSLVRNLAVNLDRISVLAVLPPVHDPDILADRERVKITVSFGVGEDVHSEILEFGYLDEARLPVGSPPLAATEDGRPAVGLWFPASGKLLQVPDQVIVTARNMVQIVPPVLSE